MKPRTEEEVRSMAPVKVKLGVAEYEIKVLTIRHSMAWRNKLSELVCGPFRDGLKTPIATDSTPESLLLSIAAAPAFLNLPLDVAEMVFAYAPELPKEEILNTATEAQILSAFHAILQIGFPYMSMLAFFTQILKGDFPSAQSHLLQ